MAQGGGGIKSSVNEWDLRIQVHSRVLALQPFGVFFLSREIKDSGGKLQLHLLSYNYWYLHITNAERGPDVNLCGGCSAELNLSSFDRHQIKRKKKDEPIRSNHWQNCPFLSSKRSLWFCWSPSWFQLWRLLCLWLWVKDASAGKSDLSGSTLSSSAWHLKTISSVWETESRLSSTIRPRPLLFSCEVSDWMMEEKWRHGDDENAVNIVRL